MKRTGWVIMMLLSTLIAVYAVMVLALPGFGAPFVADRRALQPIALYAHVAGSLVALAVGPWQLSSRLRNGNIGRHRWMGRVYVLAVLLGGLGALGLAPYSQEGLVTHVGFGMLGVLWLTATAQGYRRIRAGDQASHREWMIRSFALTLAAVALRIYLPIGLALGIPYPDAYQVISWFCWVPNLVIAEWLVLGRRRDAGMIAGND